MAREDLSNRKSNLSATKQALLQQMLQGKKVVKSSTIPRRHGQGNAPSSFAQQRLWVIDQMFPQSAVYNMPIAVYLKGDLRVELLEKSLNDIISRHETLRTTFAEVDGEPVQVIAESAWHPLPLVDLRELPEIERKAAMQRLVQEAAVQPFDLSTGPLIRFSLLQMSASEHVFVLNMHHIITDGWSTGVFVEEICQHYAAHVLNQPSTVEPLPIQYADFAYWQRDWMQGEVMDKQLSYWKRPLGGELPILQLPTDRLRPPVQTQNGAMENFQLSKELTQALNALSKQQDVTLFMTLMAGFQTLLHRYSGQDDICVGTPIAGRNRGETERLIGFFVNSLVMRGDLSGNPTFAELLRRVREMALGAYGNQDVPFERLVQEVQPNGNRSQNPLFQVMFALQNAPLSEVVLPGVTLSFVEYENKTARFDISLSMTEEADHLTGMLEYNTDLFDRETIVRMIRHFENLLTSVAADATKKLAELDLMTEEERRQLLGEQVVETFYPSGSCVHRLFEQQVERTPDAVAAVFGDERLTYRELNERANRLAHHLQKRGVGPEVRVSLYLERSLELVVGVLAIFKAGGAYVPIDTAYPEERISFILEDSQAPVLVTQTQLLANLPADLSGQPANVVCMDADWVRIEEEPATNLMTVGDEVDIWRT